MHEFQLTIPGFTIGCKSAGNPQNPPMIAMHGWLDNVNSFNLIAPFFAKHFYFIAVDFPGHGLSSHIPEGCHYHFVDGIAIVRDIIEALEYSKVHLLGHSMGACLASLVGGVLEIMTESLFLIEGLGPLSAPANTCQHQLHTYFHQHHHKDLKLARSYDSLKDASEARARNGHVSFEIAETLCQRGLKEVDGKYYWRHDKRLLHATPLRLTEEMVLSCLKGIRTNTALITASNGFNFGEGILEERIKTVKHIQQFHLEGGHHIHMEKPDEIYKAAKVFYNLST